MGEHSHGIDSAALRPTATELVVARLLAAGLTFRAPPTMTWTLRYGQTSDRLLVHVEGSGRIQTDLHAIVPGYPSRYGHYCECSLADPIRILAREPIRVHASRWVHGRSNNPELRLSARVLDESASRLLFTIDR